MNEEIEVSIISLGDNEFLKVGRHYFNIVNIVNISFKVEESEICSLDGVINLDKEETDALKDYMKERETSWNSNI